MRSLLIIIKMRFGQFSVANFLNYEKRKNKSKKLFTVLASILLLYLAGVAVLYAFLLCSSLKSAGLLDYIIPLIVVINTVLILFTSIFKAVPTIFQGKDTERLLAMPISLSAVITSKILSLLTFEYITSAFIFIPFGAAYAYFAKPSLLFYPIYLFVYLISPLFPVAVSAVFGFGIALLTTKTKNKNIFILVFSLILFGGIMAFYMNIHHILNMFINSTEDILTFIKTYLFFAYWPFKFFIEKEFIYLLYYFLLGVLPFSALVLFISAFYKKIYSKLSSVSVSTKYKEKNIKTNSATIALLKKEVKRYFSIPMYVMNTIITPVMLVILSVYMLFGGNIDMVLNEFKGLFDFKLISMIAVSFLCLLTSTSACSISLEGKRLWILKSAPIEDISVFYSKILLNIILVLPAGILSMAAFAVKFKLGIFTSVLMIAFISPAIILVSQIGLFINLCFPKMDWSSEVSVVKQSASVMLTMLFSAVFMLTAFLGYYLLNKYVDFISFEIYFAVFSALLVVFVIAADRLLKSKGRKLYAAISA